MLWHHVQWWLGQCCAAHGLDAVWPTSAQQSSKKTARNAAMQAIRAEHYRTGLGHNLSTTLWFGSIPL